MVSNLKKKRLVRFYEIMLPILALISLFTLMSLYVLRLKFFQIQSSAKTDISPEPSNLAHFCC